VVYNLWLKFNETQTEIEVKKRCAQKKQTKKEQMFLIIINKHLNQKPFESLKQRGLF